MLDAARVEAGRCNGQVLGVGAGRALGLGTGWAVVAAVGRCEGLAAVGGGQVEHSGWA